MAFLKKPLKWTALGQEPSELKKNEGFKMDESPAPGHFDFMFRSTYEAIEELQQKAGEVKTVNNVQPDVNGNVLITLPDTSKLYQKPTSGIPKTDLDATVQASLKKADDAAPLTELTKTNQALTTHQTDDTIHVKKDGTLQTGLNAQKINGKTASLTPVTTEKTDIIGMVNELFTSVSSGKTQVANAITAKGQTASGNDTFAQLATAISNIKTGLDSLQGTFHLSDTTKRYWLKTYNSAGNGGASQYYKVVIPNITFRPKLVVYCVEANATQGIYRNSCFDFEGLITPLPNVLFHSDTLLQDYQNSFQLINNGNGTYNMQLPVYDGSIVYEGKFFVVG